MEQRLLPRNVRRISLDDAFAFRCHPGVPCFTHCCRQLELALTPYDVLRLKRRLRLPSSAFLDQFVIMEKEGTDSFPHLYLTMVDDGKASCVFVSEDGCTVYPDRPGACRAYPLGRAAVFSGSTMEEFYVLLEEKHCLGSEGSPGQTPRLYGQAQGLAPYNRFNDAIGCILQHDKIRKGMILNNEQSEAFVLALYDLDTFRERILTGSLSHAPLDAPLQRELDNDESLLLFAVNWLRARLFDA